MPASCGMIQGYFSSVHSSPLAIRISELKGEQKGWQIPGLGQTTLVVCMLVKSDVVTWQRARSCFSDDGRGNGNPEATCQVS